MLRSRYRNDERASSMAETAFSVHIPGSPVPEGKISFISTVC